MVCQPTKQPCRGVISSHIIRRVAAAEQMHQSLRRDRFGADFRGAIERFALGFVELPQSTKGFVKISVRGGKIHRDGSFELILELRYAPTRRAIKVSDLQGEFDAG